MDRYTASVLIKITERGGPIHGLVGLAIVYRWSVVGALGGTTAITALSYFLLR